MKLTIQYHAGNPNMCRIPELKIRPMPECEGGGWWMPRGQAEDLLSIAKTASALSEAMDKPGSTQSRNTTAGKPSVAFRVQLLSLTFGNG